MGARYQKKKRHSCISIALPVHHASAHAAQALCPSTLLLFFKLSVLAHRVLALRPHHPHTCTAERSRSTCDLASEHMLQCRGIAVVAAKRDTASQHPNGVPALGTVPRVPRSAPARPAGAARSPRCHSCFGWTAGLRATGGDDCDMDPSVPSTLVP